MSIPVDSARVVKATAPLARQGAERAPPVFVS